MAAPTDQPGSPAATPFEDRMCEIEATCPTGFEKVVAEDIEEKLGVEVKPAQGKVYVFIPLKDVTKLLDLYSLDNLYVILKHYTDFKYADNKDAVMEQLKGIVPELDWEFGLKVWARFIECSVTVSHKPQDSAAVGPSTDTPKDTEGQTQEGTVSSSSDTSSGKVKGDTNTDADTQIQVVAVPVDEGKGDAADSASSSPAAKKKAVEKSEPTTTSAPPAISKPVHNPLMPKFRATCYRAGTTHCFQSPDAARHFGGALQDYFGWNVKMKNFDIEVVLNIDNDNINVALALTKQSLHRRHIVEFGHCTLRPTIAYCMLRICDIQPTEVVCDPMCGTGSIPLEGAVNWPEAVYVCGDVQKVCVTKTQGNISFVNEKRAEKQRSAISIDVSQWDATKLPLSDGQVDVFISDMPFGKRSGSKTNNTSLYPQLLKEWARTCRPGTGRACLLTQDRNAIKKTMDRVGKLWKHKTTHFINIGGIIAGVFLLSRTKCTDFKIPQ